MSSSSLPDLPSPLMGRSVLFGVAIRPPRYRLDGDVFTCDALGQVDRHSLLELSGEVDIVTEGNFLGLVASSPQTVREAARRLRVEWRSEGMASGFPHAADGSSCHELVASRDTSTSVSADGSPARRSTGRYGWPNRMHWGDAAGWVVADHGQGRLDIWGTSATPESLRRDLMALTGLDESAITLHGARPGSVFGRHCADDAAADATLLSRAMGRPVAVWLDTHYARDVEALGQAQRIDVSAELAPRGEIERYRYHQALAGGASPVVALWLSTSGSVPPPDDGEMSDRQTSSCSPYAFRDQRFEAPSGSRRDERAIEMQHAFARESFLDETARASGQDPIALRLRHLEDSRGIELIESVARRAGWEVSSGSTTTGPAMADPIMAEGREDLSLGRGFAYAQSSGRDGRMEDGVRSAWIADIEVNRVTGGVRLTRLVVGQDSGPSIDTSRLQETLQQRVLGEVRPLLARSPAFDEWGVDGESASSTVTGEGELVAAGNGVSRTTDDASGQQGLTGTTSLSPLDDAELSPGVAVIANALFDATGVRFREPPFTASRVRRALQQRETDGDATQRVASYRIRPRWLAGAAMAAVGAVAMAWPWKAPIAPVARPSASLYSAETIERGRLVAATGDCAACHTAEDGAVNAGGRAFDTPFGQLYSTNLTPDEATGIGNWSYAAFERAMRHGISRDGRHLYPAFPYTAFAKVGDSDMQALYAYLMAQPAVAAEPPANSLSFPFNVRSLMAGWNALFHDSSPFQPDPARTAQWNRGAYLAEGLGHCSACHTPRNALGAERGGDRRFSGAMVDGWEASPLNDLSRSPIPWSEASLYDYLRHGNSALHGVASGPMAPVVEGLGELPESDVRAIAHYVASIMDAPAGDTGEVQAQAQQITARAEASPSGMEAGERLFEGACAACHVDSGVPSFTQANTPLALNTNLHSDRPDNVIQSILGGVHASGVPGIGDMPGFADSLNDSQVVTLTAYLRARFAPDAPAWRDIDARVSAIRRHLLQEP